MSDATNNDEVNNGNFINRSATYPDDKGNEQPPPLTDVRDLQYFITIVSNTLQFGYLLYILQT